MNLILISLDSLRADALGCYGNPRARTPFLDALAQRGARFHNTIAQAPFTIPSHASMFTGLYPHHHRLREQHGQKLASHVQTLFTRLQAAGYRVASLMSARPFGPEHGYDDLNWRGSVTLENLAALVEEFRGKDFFIFIHYWDIHVPYRVHLAPRNWNEWQSELALRLEDRLGIQFPSRWRDELLPPSGDKWLSRVFRVRDLMATGRPEARAQVLAGYARSATTADRFVGHVDYLLRRLGLDHRTLLAVTADHGESFDEHGELAENPENYFHGHHLYEYLLRVPLILCGPGIPPGTSRTAPVQSIDLAPTLYDYLGTPDPDSVAGTVPMDGVSLRGLIEENRAPRDFTLSEVWRADHDCHQVAYRTTRDKLIVSFDRARAALFDLAQDPEEKHDQSAVNPGRVQELQAGLAQVWQPVADPRTGEGPSFGVTSQIPERGMSAQEEADVVARLTALGYI
ncbi:MAG: sulfatase [Anaerolineae bacterium]